LSASTCVVRRCRHRFAIYSPVRSARSCLAAARPITQRSRWRPRCSNSRWVRKDPMTSEAQHCATRPTGSRCVRTTRVDPLSQEPTRQYSKAIPTGAAGRDHRRCPLACSPAIGTDPDEARAVLHQCGDQILRQPIIDRVPADVHAIALGADRCCARERTHEQYVPAPTGRARRRALRLAIFHANDVEQRTLRFTFTRRAYALPFSKAVGQVKLPVRNRTVNVNVNG
jgi:hypothetical protein